MTEGWHGVIRGYQVSTRCPPARVEAAKEWPSSPATRYTVARQASTACSPPIHGRDNVRAVGRRHPPHPTIVDQRGTSGYGGRRGRSIDAIHRGHAVSRYRRRCRPRHDTSRSELSEPATRTVRPVFRAATHESCRSPAVCGRWDQAGGVVVDSCSTAAIASRPGRAATRGESKCRLLTRQRR